MIKFFSVLAVVFFVGMGAKFHFEYANEPLHVVLWFGFWLSLATVVYLQRRNTLRKKKEKEAPGKPNPEVAA